MESLITESLISRLQKGCICSDHDTLHLENLAFQDPPKILLVVINRYEYTLRAEKNKSSVYTDDQLQINGRTYHCHAVIYHLGESTRSGHYTAKLFYDSNNYYCDDYNVSLSDNEDIKIV